MTTKNKPQTPSFFNTNKKYQELRDRLEPCDKELLVEIVYEAVMYQMEKTNETS